jgi:hypothetical protein
MKSTTQYIVASGYYGVGYDPSILCFCFNPDGEKNCKAHIRTKSNKIDMRTIKEKTFNTLEEAKEYSKWLVKNNDGDEWLAYVRIVQVKSEIIDNVYSGSECKGCDGSGWQSGNNEGFICNSCDAACSCKKTGKINCVIHKHNNY